MANDPLIQLALRDSGVRGYSGHKGTVKWRKSSMDGRPIQITSTRERIFAWDARDRRELEDHEFVGKTVQTEFKIGMHTALRFLAKVALGGGYFLYGDSFRSAADCDPLRRLIFLDLEAEKKAGVLSNSGIKVCDRFHPDSQGSDEGAVFRVLCESLRRTLLIAVPHQDSISFHVGVVGMFVGSLIVPADTRGLPIDGDHDLGHAMVLAPGELERLSFRALAQDYYRAVTGEEPPDPQPAADNS